MKRGFAIILVLATLVLLAMLAYIFIRTALIDRNIARNYMDNKRAKLIAQSGIVPQIYTESEKYPSASALIRLNLRDVFSRSSGYFEPFYSIFVRIF